MMYRLIYRNFATCSTAVKESRGILPALVAISARRLLAENRALLDKKRTAGFLDSRPAMRYNIHRKGTVTNGLASF